MIKIKTNIVFYVLIVSQLFLSCRQEKIYTINDAKINLKSKKNDFIELEAFIIKETKHILDKNRNQKILIYKEPKSIHIQNYDSRFDSIITMDNNG